MRHASSAKRDSVRQHFQTESSLVGRRVLRRFLLVTALLAFILLGGSAGFRWIENYTWFDAIYRTLTTITTVGSQELPPLSPHARLFNAFLILFGVSAMFSAVGAITQTVLELELEDVYGRRRKVRMLASLKDHVIVCGFGRVGRNASYQLQSSEANFVVIDQSEERVARAAEAGMLAFVADATQDASLRQAGIERARGLIAALPSDAENLFVILSAKALNSHLNIVSRASEEEAGDKLKRAGAATVLTPYTMAGRQLANAVLTPDVLER